MTFEEAVQYLGTLRSRGWRLGLDRMEQFLERLDNPHLAGTKFLHVAGTNGKGTTTRFIECILNAAGYEAGGYYSPYVYNIRERISVRTEMVSEEMFAAAATAVKRAAEQMESTEFGGPTEFEFKTAMAFWVYRELGLEFVSFETGLGGRLDATNVVAPVVSVITEIGLDHQQFLGDTLEKIAFEKAGIIKPGVPCVSGVSDPRAVEVIGNRARELGSQCWQLGEQFEFEAATDEFRVRTPLREFASEPIHGGTSISARNAVIAVAAIDAAAIRVTDDEVERGVAMTGLPGRLERVRKQPEVILDGAHNPQAAGAVAAVVGRCHLVYSCATGHDPAQVLEALAPYTERLYLCQIDSDRALGLEEIALAARRIGLGFSAHRTVADAVELAVAECPVSGRILVTGSFYLLAEARAALDLM